jgi:hypothetical protein
VLPVTRLDRLARSTRDLLNILDTIAKAGAGFRSLADTWADTPVFGPVDLGTTGRLRPRCRPNCPVPVRGRPPGAACLPGAAPMRGVAARVASLARSTVMVGALRIISISF